MEDVVRALMEEQHRWIQQQLMEQNQRIEAQHYLMMEKMMGWLLNQTQGNGNKARSNACKVFDEMSEGIGVEATHQESDVHEKEVIDYSIQHELKAAKKSKNIRSYISISSDEIFEKWERGLCELCDEPYSPGHKCKKVDSNYLISLVDEEEGTTKYNLCSEKCPSIDAFQVFDEKPKRDRSIQVIEGLGEGKENFPVVPNVASSKQSDELTPSKGLCEKSNLIIKDKPDSCVQQEPKSNAHKVFDERPERTIGIKLDEKHEENIELVLFDPGGLRGYFLQSRTDFHTIHNLDTTSVVYYCPSTDNKENAFIDFIDHPIQHTIDPQIRGNVIFTHPSLSPSSELVVEGVLASKGDHLFHFKRAFECGRNVMSLKVNLEVGVTSVPYDEQECKQEDWFVREDMEMQFITESENEGMGARRSCSFTENKEGTTPHKVFGEIPKRMAFTIVNENQEDEEDNIQCDKIKTSKELVECHSLDEVAKGNWRDLSHHVFDEINQISNNPIWLSFEFIGKSVIGLTFDSIEANLGLLFIQNHIWEWDAYSCSTLLDPCGIPCVLNWLHTKIHTIHNLKASVVFDPGELDWFINSSVGAMIVRQDLSTKEYLGNFDVWFMEKHATIKLDTILMVFDPGGGCCHSWRSYSLTKDFGQCSYVHTNKHLMYVALWRFHPRFGYNTLHSYWLLVSVHKLDATSVVFDPVKLDLLVNGGAIAIVAGHSITTTESMGFLAVWLIGNHATYKHEIVIVVFDPGGKVLQKRGTKSELIVTVIHGSNVQNLLLLGSALTSKPTSKSLASKWALGLMLRYNFRSQLPTQPHISTWVQGISFLTSLRLEDKPAVRGDGMMQVKEERKKIGGKISFKKLVEWVVGLSCGNLGDLLVSWLGQLSSLEVLYNAL